jgi:hypothetical protein
MQTHKTVFFFLAQAPNREVTLSHEHKDHAWLPYEQALEKLTYDNAQTVLTQAHTYFEREQL